MKGKVAVEGSPPRDGLCAAAGIPGGMAFESGDGLVLWDASTGDVRRIAEGETSFVSDAQENLLAWCTLQCHEMHVTDVGSEQPAEVVQVSFPPEAGGGFVARDGRFSPNGQYLAMVAGPYEAIGTLVVLDMSTGTTEVVPLPQTFNAPNLEWSRDGSQLFIASNSYDTDTMTIGRYDIESGTVEAVTLPVGGGLGFVVLDRSEADAFFTDELVAPDECPSPGTSPSERTEICGFALAVP